MHKTTPHWLPLPPPASPASRLNRIRPSALLALIVLAAACWPGAVRAASVGLAGYTNAFAAQPPASDWATFSIAGATADVSTPAGVTAEVQLVSASSITQQPQADAASPPPFLATATWSSSGFYLQTRPTGNRVTLLMCTLNNGLGSAASSVTVSYSYTTNVPNGDEINGHQVYYSLSGSAGSWTPIPALSVPATGVLSATLTLDWPAASPMYLLWADDNSAPSPDTANQIDNFSFTATPAAETPAAITAQPQSLAMGELQPASFNVAVSGNPPPSVQWYSNGVAIAGVTGTNYSIAQAPLHFHGLNLTAVAQNMASNVSYSVTSDVAVLTVNADTVRPVLLGAVASGNIQVVATFSERLAPPSATNAANYSVTGPGGNLTITNAFLDASQTNVVLTVATMTPGTTYTLTVSGVTDPSAAANEVLPGSQAQFTAATYTATDIGGPAGAGSASDAGNGFAVTGGGTNIAGISDQFCYNWRQIAGDFDLKVRLDGLTGNDAWTKAGLMARETLTANSKHAAVLATPNVSGSFFSLRANNGSDTTHSGYFPVAYPNTWLRLKRAGATFTGYAGVDGQNWVQLGTGTLTTPAGIFYVGMAVSGAAPSNAPAATATAQFRDLGDGSAGVVTSVPVPFEPPGPSSRNTGLAITELMYHPRFSNDLEFIEIFNAGLIWENLAGYRISGAVDYTFPSNTVLNPGEFLVVARNPGLLEAAHGISGALGPWTGAETNGLPNDAGLVRLRNRASAVLLEINYEAAAWPLGADGAGHSLVLARPTYGENDPRAWSASDQIGGSPGRLDPYGVDPIRNVVINEFLANSEPPQEDFIELYNHGAQPVDLSGAYLSDSRDTNKYRIPDDTILPARGFLSITVSTNTTGFALNAGGERIFLVNAAQTRVIDVVDFEAQAAGVASGRYPDGAPTLRPLASPTSGTTNAPHFIHDIVINELMFNPISGSDDDEYVELHNRGGVTVDVSHWRLTAGVSYRIPSNTVITAGGFLVIAKDKTNLFAKYSQLNATNTVGDFGGSLANGGERVALARPEYSVVTNNSIVSTQVNYVVVDETAYTDSGRWTTWADGGGSSLELIDPYSDHRAAANWADSDESAKSVWTNIVVSALTDHVYPRGSPGADLNELQVMLLTAGEVLMDDLDVHAGVAGPNLVLNPTFTSGTASWTIQGNHVRSVLEPVGPNNPSQCLRLRATSGGDNGANRVECDLSSTLAPNVTNTISGRFRWLSGNPLVLLRLHGGGLEFSAQLPVPANLGTPGLPNSRRVINAGPAMADVSHEPVMPAANQSVLVTARVSDPDGVASVQLRYRVDPAATVNTLAMLDNGTGGDAVAGDGLYSATLPGQAAGALVAFRVAATDAGPGPASALFPAETGALGPVGEALVRFGDPAIFGNLGVYRIWMTASNINLWTTRERLSNQAVDGTFVYGNFRAIYNSGARYRGSPFTRNPSSPTGVGVAANYVWTLPDDEPLLGTGELNLDCLEPGGSSNVRDVTALREPTGFEMLNQMNEAFSYQRYVHIVINGVTSASRNIPVYADVQQPNGEYLTMWFPDEDDGDVYKIDDWFEFDDTPARQLNRSASLENFTTTGGVKKQARYRWTWEKKVNKGLNDDYSSLYAAVDALNAPDSTYIRQLESTFDIRQWLTVLAFRHVVGDWDGYGYRRGKNQFCYRPRNGKFHMIMWDIDFALGCNSGDPPSHDLFQVSVSSDTGENHMPEVARLYSPTNAHTRRMYYQALQRMADGPLQDAAFLPVLDARYRALQANSVAGLTSPYANSGAQGISVPAWIQQRRSHILNNANGVQPFTNASFRVLSSTNVTTTNSLVLITGSAPFGVRDILINGVVWPVTWNTVTSFTARVVVNDPGNALQITGIGFNDTVITATQTVNVTYTGPIVSPVGAVVFNEILYAPGPTNPPFVELHNTSSAAFDMSGWRINGLDYTFPAGSIITNRQYIVLGSGSHTYGTSLAIFGQFDGVLDADGETLTLLKPATTNAPEVVIDKLRYEAGPPWPVTAAGSSLQAVDSRVDNARVSNWSLSQNSFGLWRTYTTTINIGSVLNTNLFIFLDYALGAGSVIIDDLSIIAQTGPTTGTDIIVNGDFESPLAGTWGLTGNMSNSVITTEFAYSGASALRLAVTNAAGGASTNNSLWQTCPILTNTLYTLRFRYIPSTNANRLTMRFNSFARPEFIVTPPPSPPLSTPGTTNIILDPNLPPYDLVWLNELQAENVSGPLDNAGDREPWLELYNGGPTNVDLSGYYLADNYSSNLTQWQFPAGYTLAPGEFRLVWADGEPGETSGTNAHTSFRLPVGNGTVALVRMVGGQPQITDYLTYNNLRSGLSYGDFPDGQPFTRTVFQTTTPGGTNNSRDINVFVNEWMAANLNFLLDPSDNSYDDWFELYNAGPEAVDLGGYHLTDDLGNPDKYVIPNNGHYVIPPGGFLLVWADNDSAGNSTNDPSLHVSFALDAVAGEAVGLVAPDGVTVIDAVTFGPQTNNISEGRYADGAVNRYSMTTPTPGFANVIPGGNTPPVLDPIADRTVRLGQTISFNATATDADAPAQSLTFTLAGSPPAGAMINPGGHFTWTPSQAQTPSTNHITVVVTDNGPGLLSDSDTFTVIVRPPPIAMITGAGGATVTISFDTIPGRSYRVLYKDQIDAPIWTPLTAPVAAGGESLTVNDDIGPSPQRFYRIEQVD